MATTCIEEISVKINQECHKLALNNDTVVLDYHQDEASATEANSMSKIIPINDIIVCKKSEQDPKTFILHYIQKLKLMHLGAEKMVINCESEDMRDQWVITFTNLLNKATHRPKRVLVFINPDSGNKKATNIYESKVVPYFSLAEIETDVVVTKRGGQSTELLQTYDLTNIDGILAVGGDGTLADIINGIVNRMVADHNLDPNNKTITVPQIPVRLGIIPAGSGNGYCVTTGGHKDPTTSALRIIRGEEISTDVCSLCQGDKFIKWTFLMSGCGVLADSAYWSEGWIRWLGPWRYLYALMRCLYLYRSFDAEIEYLPPNSNQDDVEWQKVQGVFNFLSIFPGGLALRNDDEDTRAKNERHNEALGGGYQDMLLIHQTSRWNFLKCLKAMVVKNEEMYKWDFVTAIRAKEIKVKLHSDIEYLQNLFMIDGEVHWLDIPPNCEARTHRQVLRIFASGILIPFDQIPT